MASCKLTAAMHMRGGEQKCNAHGPDAKLQLAAAKMCHRIEVGGYQQTTGLASALKTYLGGGVVLVGKAGTPQGQPEKGTRHMPRQTRHGADRGARAK